ncbi:MAG: DUF1501 domain-containing protein [Holophagales bacterium]|nr:DUF1501 domain-containing protein [Holophagales bacterium]
MTTRRGFITGCSAAAAAFSGASFNTMAFGDPNGTNNEILVSLFLRGGIDGLNLIPPIAGADRGHYELARPNLAIPVSGSNAALPLSGGPFGIHAGANHVESGENPPATLYDLYQGGKLSVVLAAGMHEDNRSHFDSMTFMELGTPGQLSTATGWLTRHLASTSNLPEEILMPALAVGNLQQAALRGSTEAVNMSNPDSFSLNVGPHEWRDAWRSALRKLYGGSDWLAEAGWRALDAIDIIELNSTGSYTPANGAVYPSGSLGNHFETIARMIKLDIGLRVATIDYGGWDTHNGQGEDGGGYFFTRVQELSRALAAFYTDLDGSGAGAYIDRVTIVVMSEFGRRLRENADRGSDHGHGNVMLVLGGSATGGVHGTFPGLANDDLFDGADLEVTTDYRRVLSEILIRRLGNPNLGQVFPGYSGYSPLGVVSGPDQPPIYGPGIFADGFETGSTGAWAQG